MINFFKTRLPVKWMLPESLFYGLSSTVSDMLVVYLCYLLNNVSSEQSVR